MLKIYSGFITAVLSLCFLIVGSLNVGRTSGFPENPGVFPVRMGEFLEDSGDFFKDLGEFLETFDGFRENF